MNDTITDYSDRHQPAGDVLIRGRLLVVMEPFRSLFQEVEDNFEQPFIGVTTDGTPKTGLYTSAPAGDTSAARAAASKYLALLAERSDLPGAEAAVLPLSSNERRKWTNAFPTWAPAGLRLNEVDAELRDAALAVLEASLSPGGYAKLRDLMKLNLELGDIVGDRIEDTFIEFGYWFTIYGSPSDDAWAWQLMGHHICLTSTFIGDEQVFAPAFMGAETDVHHHGPMYETPVFRSEELVGRALLDSLSEEQRAQAVIFDSLMPPGLPDERLHMADGRGQGGAGRDNLVAPYEGLAGASLTPAQAELLLALVKVYTSRMPADQAAVALERVRAHLADTHFAWMGSTEPGEPCYYKVHGPTVFIEFDCQSGIFIPADRPVLSHVHTVFRLPNGGDYGFAALDADPSAAQPQS